jgi:hypothetical protein
MDDFLGHPLVPPASLVALVIAIVWLVVIGWLVPRWTYKEIVTDRNYWRELSMTLMEQNKELMIGARVATHITEALPISGRRD